MTPQSDQTAGVVEEMLLDAGMEQDAELRRVLLAVGSLAALPVPAPSGQLAALLGVQDGGAPKEAPHLGSEKTTDNTGDELGRRRRLRAHRPTVLGLALVAGMGMGVGTVAASSAGPAPSGSLSVQQLLEDWSPSWTIGADRASGPEFLHTEIDDDGGHVPVQGDSSLAGSESAYEADPAALQPSGTFGQAPVAQPPGKGSIGFGEPSAANGQDGMKEPEEHGPADSASPGTGPGQFGPPDADTGNGNKPAVGEKFGPAVGPASKLLTGSGQGAGGQDAEGQGAGTAPGAESVTGTKWLEKFGR